ncbi:cation:dicarboxylate symporter family transporter [Methanosphaerula palustris]|uniref:Extracellular solute-binding protein family 3 n=1 Tax=Methanosphaerula palustris (strain ATCC BAA-1556 / DSM 19958 / E1-9c) TaxID=521011 RepID=B8GDR0_METPE|nr:cation:dicarboxylase symporter family transporter [Methanosphaerula palustris]ACL17411.1 extracellular solute-binding protein family 3 [Methanosphaerula palustris E1-9c]
MRLRSLNLTIWILLGFILGALAGLFFGDLCSVLKPFSDAFIKIWQITILPSVVLSLIVGIGSLKRDSARAIAVKAGLVLLLFWAIGVGIFFSFQWAFPPREAASFFSAQDLTETVGFNIIDQFIPSNPFQSLSEGIIPATVLFCLFLGFALMMDDGSGPILSSLRILLGALTRMTSILSRTFPIGVFVITASTAGTMTFEGFLDLQVYLVSLAAATVLLGLVVLPLLITCFTTFRYRDILAASSRAVVLAFSTGSEFITLPLIIEGVRKLFEGPSGIPVSSGAGGNADRPDDLPQEDWTGEMQEQAPDWRDVRSYSEILVPVAYTFPLLGGITPFLFILFVAWLYQSPSDLMQQVQLIAVGIPTFFGSSKLSVVSLLNLMHLPADAYNLYISMGILRQCFVAALSCMSIFSFSTISIALITNRGRMRWRRMIPSVVLILLLTFIMIGGLKMGFALLLANTYHGNDQISQMDLPLDLNGARVDVGINTTVYSRVEDVPPLGPYDLGGGGEDVKQIRERGVLRVGYNSNNIPFVFFNGKGDLVGYDVQMAYDLARFVNVTRVEFVPITGATLADSLNSGYCDIVMSSVAVTPERLDEMKFTDSYVTVHMSFVVPDEQKAEFSKLENVKKMKGLRVAVFNNTALVKVAAQMLPGATIVPIDSEEEFFVEKKADALITTAEEGYTMTMQYPFYDVAIIEPNDSYQMMYGYAVAQNSSDTYLMSLNYWLKMEKDYGNLNEKYNYWILGKDAGLTEPRWSVVRNVLHWET